MLRRLCTLKEGQEFTYPEGMPVVSGTFVDNTPSGSRVVMERHDEERVFTTRDGRKVRIPKVCCFTLSPNTLVEVEG